MNTGEKLTIAALSTLVVGAATLLCSIPASSSSIDNNAHAMVYVLFKRIQNIEKTSNIKVPEELKLTVNGELE